jgi:hypothetical protein
MVVPGTSGAPTGPGAMMGTLRDGHILIHWLTVPTGEGHRGGR